MSFSISRCSSAMRSNVRQQSARKRSISFSARSRPQRPPASTIEQWESRRLGIRRRWNEHGLLPRASRRRSRQALFRSHGRPSGGTDQGEPPRGRGDRRAVARSSEVEAIAQTLQAIEELRVRYLPKQLLKEFTSDQLSGLSGDALAPATAVALSASVTPHNSGSRAFSNERWDTLRRPRLRGQRRGRALEVAAVNDPLDEEADRLGRTEGLQLDVGQRAVQDPVVAAA